MLTTLLSANIAQAQKSRYPMHELSVSVSGGISNFVYSLDEGSHSSGFGGGLDVGYSYNVKRWLAIVTGFGVSLYNSKLNMDKCSENYTGYDNAGDEFTLNYSVAGYSEQQNAVLFTIPVMARYSTSLGKGALRYYAAGGLKLGIPISATASINAKTVTTSGYYVFEYGEYTDLPKYGFVNGAAGDKTDFKIKLGFVALLALETGIRFPVGYKKDLMTGIYLDYSPGNISQSHNRHVLEYQPLYPSKYVYNSVINTNLLNKVHLISAGLKVGLSF
jgi:hypothetical protein